ncbi:MAG: hypothetical protein KJ000_06645 [Pirellulaceae bacterium]|nr:hypothetical protein [Pirellulaceae bacterium]
MFGWFKAPCPVDLREKVWTELRLGWLVEGWGWQRLREGPVILPTASFFEIPERGGAIDAERVLTDVCRYVGSRRESLRLEFAPAESLANGSGEYLRGDVATVRLAEFWRDDLESLIAMLAHYAALDLLLRDGRCRDDESDLGWYADLACVFLGMGIFGANSAIKQRSGSDGTWTWWQIRARRHLPARVFGYAMALVAAARGERRPRWADWLGDDARDTFQRGCRFLQRRGECVLDLEANGALRVAGSVPSLAADLRHGNDSLRLASLWALLEYGSASAAALDEVAACLRSGSSVLRSEAARVIGAIGVEKVAVSDELMALLDSRDRTVCCSALTALGQLQVPLDREGPRGEIFLDELRMLITDDDVQVAQTAVLTLCRYGRAASEAFETLAGAMLEPLRRALVACDYRSQDLYFTALHAVFGGAEEFLQTHFQEYDPDLYPLALGALELYRQQHRNEP